MATKLKKLVISVWAEIQGGETSYPASTLRPMDTRLRGYDVKKSIPDSSAPSRE